MSGDDRLFGATWNEIKCRRDETPRSQRDHIELLPSLPSGDVYVKCQFCGSVWIKDKHDPCNCAAERKNQ